jgi:hypothetical protein
MHKTIHLAAISCGLESQSLVIKKVRLVTKVVRRASGPGMQQVTGTRTKVYNIRIEDLHNLKTELFTKYF